MDSFPEVKLFLRPKHLYFLFVFPGPSVVPGICQNSRFLKWLRINEWIIESQCAWDSLGSKALSLKLCLVLRSKIISLKLLGRWVKPAEIYETKDFKWLSRISDSIPNWPWGREVLLWRLQNECSDNWYQWNRDRKQKSFTGLSKIHRPFN